MTLRKLVVASWAGWIAVSAQAGSVDVPLQIGGAFSVPAVSLKEGRFAATVRQEHDFSCGSAALSTLLTHHYQHPVSERSVFDEMVARGDVEKIRREGFSMLDMKRYLQAHGFEADGFEAPLTSLAEAEVPAIALITENGFGHFVVVKGLRNGWVLIGDPATGTRSVRQAFFDSLRVNQILFVIGNRLDVARFNAPTDWQVAPRAPMVGAGRDSLAASALPKLGSSDF